MLTIAVSANANFARSLDPLRTSSQPRIVVDTYLPFNTGGPEALVQLSIALHRVYNNTFVFRKAIHTRLRWEYREIEAVPTLFDLNVSLARNDVFIAPDIRHYCNNPKVDYLLERGVHVYTYLLGMQQAHKAFSLLSQQREKCFFLSHNFWLSSFHPQLHLSRSLVVRPYITPRIVNECLLVRHKKSLKRNVILLDPDSPPFVFIHLNQTCSAVSPPLCEVVQPPPGWSLKGRWSDAQMRLMRSQARIVVDWCLVGSERLPIEAVLCGAVFVTSDSNGCLNDFRDFPLPRALRVKDLSQLDQVVRRILSNFAEHQQMMIPLAALYSGLNGSTMAEEAKAAVSTMLKPAPHHHRNSKQNHM